MITYFIFLIFYSPLNFATFCLYILWYQFSIPVVLKVRTVNLFGEIWGVGPATALKLYEKGHRNLDDLKHDDSLTAAQKIGLKYFDDIKTRIPRHEVQNMAFYSVSFHFYNLWLNFFFLKIEVKDMEMLLQNAGQEVLPGVSILENI